MSHRNVQEQRERPVRLVVQGEEYESEISSCGRRHAVESMVECPETMSPGSVIHGHG
jgi:hypothetical protein